MGNFISTIKKYAVAIADIVFVVGAVVSAVELFVKSIDQHFPDKTGIKNEK